MRPYSLSKSEKLKSRTIISDLFQRGRSDFIYPLKVLYLPVSDADVPAQVAFTVPKRGYKKAVQRNHIKRHMREQYRLQKPNLYKGLEEKETTLAMMYIYVGKSIEDVSKLEKAFKKLSKKIISAI